MPSMKGMGWLLGRRPCIHSGERACTNNVICSAFNIKLCETVLCMLTFCQSANSEEPETPRGRQTSGLCVQHSAGVNGPGLDLALKSPLPWSHPPSSFHLSLPPSLLLPPSLPPLPSFHLTNIHRLLAFCKDPTWC